MYHLYHSPSGFVVCSTTRIFFYVRTTFFWERIDYFYFLFVVCSVLEEYDKRIYPMASGRYICLMAEERTNEEWRVQYNESYINTRTVRFSILDMTLFAILHPNSVPFYSDLKSNHTNIHMHAVFTII